MIKVRTATPEDVHEVFKNRREYFSEDALAGMLNCLDRGVALTLFDADGNIGCVIGFILIWNGVASCGAITSDFMFNSPISYARIIRRLIEMGMIRYNVHRVELTVEAGRLELHKWARTLGFMAEGTLEKYGPDKKDHVIYGRVSE